MNTLCSVTGLFLLWKKRHFLMTSYVYKRMDRLFWQELRSHGEQSGGKERWIFKRMKRSETDQSGHSDTEQQMLNLEKVIKRIIKKFSESLLRAIEGMEKKNRGPWTMTLWVKTLDMPLTKGNSCELWRMSWSIRRELLWGGKWEKGAQRSRLSRRVPDGVWK